MKHATASTLDRLGPLLARIRTLGGLAERKPGTFYRRSSAFLHFHEDPSGLFADVKLNGEEFERMPVSSRSEREAFWKAVSSVCGAPGSRGKREESIPSVDAEAPGRPAASPRVALAAGSVRRDAG
jgi:hypothetical protein